ncbi:hypothetical protein PINS_up015164 [Pythium insidiosum]|nr:hypothetical protein PINS_up015164 [Pythium insidiosum]
MTTFEELPLREELQAALRALRFERPSPIQLKALPLALFGSDVIGQSKSGTGKTAVFGVAAIEHVLARLEQLSDAPLSHPTARAYSKMVGPFVLVLAPTREIAMQIHAVLAQLAAFCESCSIVATIGGLAIADDQVTNALSVCRSVCARMS